MKKIILIFSLILALFSLDIQAVYANKNEELFTAIKRGRIERVEELLRQNVDINRRDSNKYTALMLAVQHKNTKILRLLLAHNFPDVNLQNQEGFTALMLAVENNNLEAVQILLDTKRVNIHMTNKKGESARKIAENKRYKRIIDILKQHGAL